MERIHVPTLVQYISSVLNDQEPGYEFTVWDEQFLTAAVREAATAIGHAHPRALAVPAPVVLAPGSVQTLPAIMQEGFAVTSQQCGDKLHMGFSRVAVEDFSPACQQTTGRMVFAVRYKPSTGNCGSSDGCGGWLLDTWAWDAASPASLYVSPPVPNDSVVRTLTVTYTGAAYEGDTLRLSDSWQSAVVAFVLHRAYTKDVESSTHASLAAENMKLFLALLGIESTGGA